MMNEWTDRLPYNAAGEIWQRQTEDAIVRRIERIEADLRRIVDANTPVTGFYEAMRMFLTLRRRLFPSLPDDPALKLLITLAQTPEGSGKSSISGICYGAEVPQTTALRYLTALEIEGVIRRVPHPQDGRQVLLQLTDEGRQKIRAIADQWMLRLAWVIFPMALILSSILDMLQGA
ncbi:MAG: winged helix DNA-binding protein [Sphingomonas sp.]